MAWEEVQRIMDWGKGPWPNGFDGSLGVFGFNANVAFRNVTVTPLPGQR